MTLGMSTEAMVNFSTIILTNSVKIRMAFLMAVAFSVVQLF